MSTRLEALEQAFDGLQAAENNAVTETPPDPPAAPEETKPARDEAGRFASRAEKTEAAEIKPAEEVKTEPVAKPRPNAPASWKPEKRAKWETIDPEIAEYINQREEESNRGVEPLKKVWHELSPYLQRIQANGQTPEAFVRDLAHTANLLATADPHTKHQVLMNIARAYNVPLDLQQQTQNLDPATAQLHQELQQIKGTVLTWQQQAELAAQQQAQQMIADFAKDKPHFEAVKTKMGELIQKGLAPDLDTAYKLAIRIDEDLFNQVQAQQREADEKAKREAADVAAKAAKANAVSPKSATPSAAATATVTAKGRRAALEQAVSSHLGSGRI